MNLTPHFTLEEFCASEIAARLGINNTLPKELVPSVMELCKNVLEPARLSLGPIRVNSGYRSPALNRETPASAKNSQHIKGEAADIIPLAPGCSTFELFLWLYKHAPFDQLIWEFSWVHVSHVAGGPQRGGVFAAVRIPGKRLPAYTPLTEEQILALGG
jgi:hypothetical protein